jgi:hypothetical protein
VNDPHPAPDVPPVTTDGGSRFLLICCGIGILAIVGTFCYGALRLLP